MVLVRLPPTRPAHLSSDQPDSETPTSTNRKVLQSFVPSGSSTPYMYAVLPLDTNVTFTSLIFPRPCPWDFFRQLARRDVLVLAFFTRLACRAVDWGRYFGRGLCVLCFCFFCLHYIPYDACANTTGVRLVYFFCYLFACAFNFLRSVFIHKSLYVPTGRAATNGTICSAFGLELADCVFHGAYCFVRY